MVIRKASLSNIGTTPGNYFFDHPGIVFKDNWLQHEFLLGASLIFKNFGIFLDSKWSHSNFYMNLLPPPES